MRRCIVVLVALAGVTIAAADQGPEQGTLVIVGGAMQDPVIVKRFIDLAGGPDAPIVIIPTAGEADDEYDQYWSGLKQWRENGARKLTVLHTRDRKVADSDAFVQPIRDARGVFFAGGRQWRLADSYLETRTHRELAALLTRGGVVGGSSAGASILSSFMIRGDTKSNEKMIGDHTVGLGFLKNAAIDQHLLRRNRQFDMLEVIDKHPGLLGIGLDEDTAIVVRGDQFEVIGRSYVVVYSDKPVVGSSGRFYFMGAGDRFDMKGRKATRQGNEWRPLPGVRPSGQPMPLSGGQNVSSEVASRVAAARAAAGEDYVGLFNRLCTPEGAIAAAIAPKPVAPPPARPAAPKPAGPPAKSTWETPPAKVFDNLYFVGEKEYSAWAVTTPDGIIIIDTIFEYSVDSQIAGGLRSFGLDPAAIKYAIVSHGHRDHSGGAKYLQDSFKTRVLLSAADWDMLAANTRDPAKPSRDLVISDGQALTLGGTTLTMYLTPGHTPGTVSTILPVTDGGRKHVAAYWGGTAFNFGPDKQRLEQYAASARRFADLVKKAGADVLLSNHTIFDGSKTKLPALATRKAGGPHPYVIGTESVLRYLKVAEECAQAIRLQLP